MFQILFFLFINLLDQWITIDLNHGISRVGSYEDFEHTEHHRKELHERYEVVHRQSFELFSLNSLVFNLIDLDSPSPKQNDLVLYKTGMDDAVVDPVIEEPFLQL